MKIKNAHTAVMCRTLSKTIWSNPIRNNYQTDLDEGKIQIQCAYSTNFNEQDFDVEGFQRIILIILENCFHLVNDNNKKEIDIIEFEIEADGNYSFRFSTTCEFLAPTELAFIVTSVDKKLSINPLDISNLSLSDAENLVK